MPDTARSLKAHTHARARSKAAPALCVRACACVCARGSLSPLHSQVPGGRLGPAAGPTKCTGLCAQAPADQATHGRAKMACPGLTRPLSLTQPVRLQQPA
eukprot:scaffold82464_cov20-Tisochrysis_lutea.AAC.2